MPPSSAVAFSICTPFTNVPFALPEKDARHLLLALELAGTPSNNVQAAFGRDANTNGVLEVEETGMALGWDCGVWKVRSGVRSVECGVPSGEWTAEAVTTNEVKCLTAVLHVSRQRASRLTLSENGVALTAQPLRPLPTWLYDPTWDMIRLTSRGVDAPCESFRASVKVDPFVFILK